MSSTTLDPCFQYIVGLATTDCECVTDDAPPDYNVSDSGLHVTGLEGFNIDVVKSADNCTNGDLWEIMDSERASAVEDLKAALLPCIKSKTKNKRSGFRGAIGEAQKMSKNSATTHTYHGLKVAFANIPGGYIKIKAIGAAFAFTGTITVNIYDNTSDDIIETVVVDTESNKLKWTTLTTPLEISLDAPAGYDYLILDFLYEPTGGQQYRDTKITCSTCGGTRPYFNLASPMFLGKHAPSYAWTQFAIAAGTKGNTLSTRQSWSTQNETQGLLLDIELGCKAETTICNGSLNYDDNEIPVALAHAIRYRIGARLYSKALSGSNVNRFNTVSAEHITTMRDEWQKAFNQYIYDFLCTEITEHGNLNLNSDCLTCSDEYSAVRKSLLV